MLGKNKLLDTCSQLHCPNSSPENMTKYFNMNLDTISCSTLLSTQSGSVFEWSTAIFINKGWVWTGLSRHARIYDVEGAELARCDWRHRCRSKIDELHRLCKERTRSAFSIWNVIHQHRVIFKMNKMTVTECIWLLWKSFALWLHLFLRRVFSEDSYHRLNSSTPPLDGFHSFRAVSCLLIYSD